jgi:hypothetical protein
VTRQEKAEELYSLMLRLPIIYQDVKHQSTTGDNYGFPSLTIKAVNEKWRLWFDTWISPEVIDLVPELKKYRHN